MSQGSLFGESSGANFSEDGVYRYALWRLWGENVVTPHNRLTWIMLNPSSANEVEDDPTIRRCQSFARAWGHSGVYIVNLFAYRSTDPKKLRKVADPVGPKNNMVILSSVLHSSRVVAAWGIHGSLLARADKVMDLLAPHCSLLCLGRTKGGQPRHPLYLRQNTVLEILRERAE